MYFVGAYWPARPEAPSAIALRLERFLSDVVKVDSHATNWLALGTRKSRTVIGTSASELAKLLTIQRRDVGGQAMPELGFGFNAWSRSGYSLSCTLGASDSTVTNCVVVSNTHPDTPPMALVRGLMKASVDAFRPTHAVATSHEILERANAVEPWDAGWFVYRDGETIVPGNLPPSNDPV